MCAVSSFVGTIQTITIDQIQVQDIANDLPAAECQCHCNPKWPRSRDPSETPTPKRSFREEEFEKSTIHKCEEIPS